MNIGVTGSELAKENDIKADLVVPVPDSGVPAAIGYSENLENLSIRSY